MRDRDMFKLRKLFYLHRNAVLDADLFRFVVTQFQPSLFGDQNRGHRLGDVVGPDWDIAGELESSVAVKADIGQILPHVKEADDPRLFYLQFKGVKERLRSRNDGNGFYPGQ